MGPAFRGAIEQASNALGVAAEGLHSNAKEQAITDAMICMARLRVAVTEKVKTVNPHFVDSEK